MLRLVLLLLLFFLAFWARGQETGTPVTRAQLDAAVAEVTGSLAADDPLRANLLQLYDNIGATLTETEQHEAALESFAQARAGAAKQAAAIQAGLAERQVAVAESVASLGDIPLAELEQQIQVNRAELDARKSKLAEIQGQINSMPARAAEIRDRLTTLGSVIPDLKSRLALLPEAVVSGGEGEADLWLLQAQIDEAVAEKAVLDEELLSQPMRLQLLTARQDQARHDISGLERALEAMERQATLLREDKATQAQADAEQQVAEARGKHRLVQELADANAMLSSSFIERGEAIEQARMRESTIGNQVERLESDLKSIEHKLNVLGMSTAVGQILREQQVQLTREQFSRKEISQVSEQLRSLSVRQIELEDKRRKLVDLDQFVDALVIGLDPETAQRIQPDLQDLARKRRELVKQALELETLYARSLGNLEYNLQQYQLVVDSYRNFIGERLLWIPSRDPFSLMRSHGLPVQLGEIFVPGRWLEEIRASLSELAQQPLLVLLLVVGLALVFLGPRIRDRIVVSGREVGFVRTDAFSNTLLALGLSLVLSTRWPLLMWTVASLFERPTSGTDLSTALHSALSQGAAYFWGLEFLRALLIPRGLATSHFRWPAQSSAVVYRSIVLLEQTFLPAAILVFFAVSIYPEQVGGRLGALGAVLMLLSMAYFFRHVLLLLQGKVSMLLRERGSRVGSILRTALLQLLVWVPLLASIAVLFGYIYTAMVFSLLLVKTFAVLSLVLLFNELAMRWLVMTRRRMVVRARAEAAQSSADEDEVSPEEEAMENDPELLGDDGAELINLLTLLGLFVGTLAIWAEVLPALNLLDSVQLWHRTGVVDGIEVPLPVTLGDLFVAILVAVLGWIALSRIPGLLEIFLRQKLGVRAASAYAATRVFQYAATTVLVVGVLSAVGGSWSQIQWAVAALSVGIGFGLQEIVANFISGLIILFEQPIRVGDTVTVGPTSGRVTKIHIRATTIRDFDRRELLVPNKEFITQQLLNWSLSDQVTRWSVEVGVAYGSDLNVAMAEVREAVRRQPLILAEPAPIVTFESFGDNSLLIQVRFFMEQLDERIKVSSDLRLDINCRLNEHGIVVAFPQRDVHLDTSQPLEVKMLQPGQAPPEQPASS